MLTEKRRSESGEEQQQQAEDREDDSAFQSPLLSTRICWSRAGGQRHVMKHARLSIKGPPQTLDGGETAKSATV